MQTHGMLLVLAVVALFGAHLPTAQGCLSCHNHRYWRSVNDFLREALREVTAHEVIIMADANQDGKLSVLEAYEYLRPLYDIHNPERFTIHNLEKYNNNGDGYLSASEIEFARKQLAIESFKHDD